jgi:hypothetical protein
MVTVRGVNGDAELATFVEGRDGDTLLRRTVAHDRHHLCEQVAQRCLHILHVRQVAEVHCITPGGPDACWEVVEKYRRQHAPDYPSAEKPRWRAKN